MACTFETQAHIPTQDCKPSDERVGEEYDAGAGTGIQRRGE